MSEGRHRTDKKNRGGVPYSDQHPTGILVSGTFVIPPKRSAAVTILDASSDRTVFNGSQARPAFRPSGNDLAPGKRATSSHPLPPQKTPTHNSHLQKESVTPQQPTQTDTIAIIGGEDNARNSRSKGAGTPSSPNREAATRLRNEPAAESHTVQSNLDIYAANYVPSWLKAVNDSYATTRACCPLNSFNCAEYIRTYAGSSFISPLPEVNLPSLSPTSPTQSSVLTTQRYGQSFRSLMQDEFVAQAAELQGYYLYGVHLDAENSQQHLFRLSIPGTREGLPRVDLGDTVLIRPLLPCLEQQASIEAKAWYDSGAQASGVLAPYFSGVEYRAVIWGVSKRTEQVILRIDGFAAVSYCRCNVLFVVQRHRASPLWRTITCVGKALEEDQASRWLRRMLFPQDEDCLIQRTLPKGIFELDWLDSMLNYEQQKAVNTVVNNGYGAMPYLIWGPPGTGKTKTIVEAMLQLLKSVAGAKHHLLLCAPSDPAADTLASRLSAHLTPKELFRLNSWTRSFAEVPGNLLPYTYAENDLFSLPPFEKMMSFTVVVTTCRDADLLVQAQLTNQSLGSMMLRMASGVLAGMTIETSSVLHWTGLLLDEAAQATEPEALVPISVVDPGSLMGSNGAKFTISESPQLILAGDGFQLGPRLARRKLGGLHISLFERLFSRSSYANHPLSRSRGLKSLTSKMLPMAVPAFANLTRNYRSHPAILSTPSLLFYYDTLIPEQPSISAEVATWKRWARPLGWPVLFRQNKSADSLESILVGDGTGAGGLFNAGEAQITLHLVKDLLRHSETNLTSHALPVLPREIMVMSPFRAQVKLLRARFREAGLHDVNIGPLEAFQGLESRIVVICTTRTRVGTKELPERFVREDQQRGLGVIDEPRRLNVAMTRAKEGLIVIGDWECLTCTKDLTWMAFLAFCHRNDCIDYGDDVAQTLKIEPVEPATSAIGRLEKALRYAEVSGLCENGKDQNATTPQGFGLPDPPRSRHNVLKGSMPTTDEQMWSRGMIFVDDEEEELDEINTETGQEAPPEKAAVLKVEPFATPVKMEIRREMTGKLIKLAGDSDDALHMDQRSSPKVEGATFDRDLVAEFEKAECPTQ